SDIRYHEALFLNRYVNILNLINGYNKKQIESYYYLGNFIQVNPERLYSRLLDLFNMKYILSPTTLYRELLIGDIIDEGETYSAVKSGVRRSLFEISGEKKDIIYEHPPSIINYSLQLSKGDPSLKFALGMDSMVWTPNRGDGVHFEARLGKDGKENLLYTKYIDPKNNFKDRRWHEVEIDLNAFQGKFIKLKFITNPGPRGDFNSDWAGWGDLRIEGSDRADESKFELILDEDVKLYRNRQAFPRVFILHQAEVIESEEEILTRIASEEFNLRKRIILEEQIPELWLTTNSTRPKSDSVAKIVDYRANTVGIEANMAEEGFLVLSDTYYPGWRVWVDGKEEKIYCADYFIRAVHLSPGFHQIKFAFDPLSFEIGLWMTISTIFFLGGLFAYSKLRKKNDINNYPRI
ncbi:MAG: YfhO family protein, partial [Deltaproteobacteria bacterium]